MNFNVSKIGLLPLIIKSATKQLMSTLNGRFKFQLLLLQVPPSNGCRHYTADSNFSYCYCKCHQATDADIIRQIQISAIAIASVTKQRMPTLYGRFKFQLLLSKLLLSTNCL